MNGSYISIEDIAGQYVYSLNIKYMILLQKPLILLFPCCILCDGLKEPPIYSVQNRKIVLFAAESYISMLRKKDKNLPSIAKRIVEFSYDNKHKEIYEDVMEAAKELNVSQEQSDFKGLIIQRISNGNVLPYEQPPVIGSIPTIGSTGTSIPQVIAGFCFF